jgi:hypothetical protein
MKNEEFVSIFLLWLNSAVYPIVLSSVEKLEIIRPIISNPLIYISDKKYFFA